MSRFNKTKVNSASGTVDVGAGLTWDQVFATLESTGVNVVGGRIPGIGVAGLTLGGGYSFLSSQYGLTLDNVAGYELVLPNGTVTTVTSEDDDLWFGLRGGLNNFSYAQGNVWGGIRFYSDNQLDAIKEALFKYQQKNDTRAKVDVSLSYSSGQLLCAVLFFYDAPTPSGVYDDFLDIPAIKGNVSTTSFFDFFQSLGPQGTSDNHRVFEDTASVIQYSPAVFDAFVDQINIWGRRLQALDENVALALVLEPFDKDIFSHGTASAYPPDRSHAIFPSSLTFEWSNASLDDTMAFALRNISNSIRAAALADGQDVSHAALYPNYALFGTPLEDMYGGNVERLRKIKAAIDPEDVMGLAGGWKF
jgi:hypothetical protein